MTFNVEFVGRIIYEVDDVNTFDEAETIARSWLEAEPFYKIIGDCFEISCVERERDGMCRYYG